MDILLYFGGPALIAFLIQFLVGCRTQHKILRYIPIYCFVITLAFAIIALTSDSGFFLGGNVIAALVWCIIGVCFLIGYVEMSRNVQSGNTQNLKSMVIQRSFPKWSVAERRKTAAASDQAAVCACAHSRYFAGGSPSGLRV